MKKTIVVLLGGLMGFSACKKREENPSVSSPNAENVRITEIIDTNITRDSLELHKRFYYDAQGRITKIESFGRYPSVEKYSYENGLLSSITSTRSDGSVFTRTFGRENGQISTVLRELNGTVSYTDTYSYDAEGHLIQWVEKNGQSTVGDTTTTTYSEFVAGRYTRSFKSFKLVFVEDTVPKRVIQRELRTFDEVGKLMSLQQTMMGQGPYGPEPKLPLVDSGGIETVYNYFPLSELQRSMTARQREINRHYYSSNLDVLELIIDPSLSLPNLYQASQKTYANGIIIEQSTSIIEKVNGTGLPISILTTDPGETRDYPFLPRPASQIRRIIRYEVD